MNNRFSRSRLLALAVVSGLATFFPPAADYPTRPIRVVVPWPPGGPTDAVARVISQEISESLRQPVVIDNKAGATGVLGSVVVERPPPEGHPFVVPATASNALAKIASAKLPYDPLKDFRPI